GSLFPSAEVKGGIEMSESLALCAVVGCLPVHHAVKFLREHSAHTDPTFGRKSSYALQQELVDSKSDVLLHYGSMAKMADAGEDHRQIETVGCGDDFFIANGAAGLDDGLDSVFSCLFHAIRKRKKRVGADDCAGERQN